MSCQLTGRKRNARDSRREARMSLRDRSGGRKIGAKWQCSLRIT